MSSCDGCYGIYHRTSEGEWLYRWGQPVPDAQDMTLRDVLLLGPASDLGSRNGDPDDALHDSLVDDHVLAATADDVPGDLDRVVGLFAPELHVRGMLTINDVADLVGVEPNTIAAYRYRGYLPEPQAVIGRAPVWSRPVIRHWLETRPGNGWRTDIYGNREEYDEHVRHMRAARRKAMAQRRHKVA